jgi:hypothetical protein
VWTIIQFHIFQRNVSTFKSFKIELFVCISWKWFRYSAVNTSV